MKKVIVVALLAAALAGCGGDGGGDEAGPATTRPATSSSTLPAIEDVELVMALLIRPGDNSGVFAQSWDVGAACGIAGITRPTDDWAVMDPGVTVTLEDEDGTRLGVATLEIGEVLSSEGEGHERETLCAWTVDMEDVPEARIYTVRVDGEEVGAAPASERQDGKLTIALD